MEKGIGDRIKNLRERNGLTLGEFASAVGISTSHLSLIEHGKRDFRVSVFLRICKEFKIKPSSLAGDNED